MIVAAHIPPGIHTPRGVQWYQETFSQLLISIFKDFADVIKAMHFGHDHYDGFKVLTDNDGEDDLGVPSSVSLSLVTLRASLSGTFLQTLPDLVTPLKGHSLSPRSCPATRSAPSERFGY